MSLCVLDCSLALCWCFDDEATEQTYALMDRVYEHEAWVPDLWHLEVVNALLQAKKRGRVTSDQIKEKLIALSRMPIRVDDETGRHAFHLTRELAEAEGLTAYDASYLELAMRRKLPLATKDGALINACEKRGVDCIPL